MNRIQKIGVSAFIFDNNKALIVKRSKNENFLPGYFELPGGIIEFGESPEQALIREIKEELNLNIRIIKPYSTFSYISGNQQKHTIDIQFIVKIDDDINNLKLSKEHEYFKWIGKEEINNYKFSNEMKQAIKKGFRLANS